MGIITTSSFAKALAPGVNAWYGKAYTEYPVEFLKLFEKYDSNRSYEEDVGTSGFGLLGIKTEGGPISYDSERQGYTTRFTHVEYSLGFIITRIMMEDDLYDVVGQRRAQGLAFSVRQTKEILGANVYNRAFNSSYTGGDGKELIATDHPNVAGGTWSNELATPADLSEAALEQAVIDIAGFTNDRGLKIAVKPQSLIIPWQLAFEAHRILKTAGRYGTADNDTNALRDMGLFKDVVVNHFLTDTDAWFIRTNTPHGMKYWERRADEFGSDNDFDTENAKFKASFRCAFGWTDPRGLYGSAGA